MTCPRCDSNKTHVLAESPVGKVWTVYICDDCYFSWRSTESEEITNPAKYSKKWKLTAEKIANLQVIPPVAVPKK